ncbi:MAG: phosphoenolpyruvate--protein phosphotransferase [Clostridium sp.]|jgi:phosphotransferase system enzyme I (PtsI)|nr:phosphoenolpyruvate--protein phosphotransferase [Clostridium sp.]
MRRKVFKAEAVSLGIGIGRIFIIKEPDVKANKNLIDESQIENEITNLEVAICRTFIEIHDLNDGFKGILSEEENRIFDFYTEILDDKSFFEEINNTIKHKKYSAQRAIHTCIQKYMDEILKSDNEYIKQRAFDLDDVRKRLIKNISGSSGIRMEEITRDHIVLVDELKPILAAELGKKEVRGVVAREGAGYFTHASIILRSTGIPTLNGVCIQELDKFLDRPAILDAINGVLIVNPSEHDIKNCKRNLIKKTGSCVKDSSEDDALLHDVNNESLMTKDGVRVHLFVNISSVKEFIMAKKLDIEGIGLVRTESLFINYKKIPDEKRQFAAYQKMVASMTYKPVIIRTTDIGGDKVPGVLSINDKSLSRSSRGIKRSLEQRQEFVTQIRAILRAAEYGNASISFPMVETAEEIKEARKIIDDVNDELEETYGKRQKIRVGTMIETALAVENLEEILEQVDFISIGTNDMLHQICEQSRKCSTLEKRSYLEPIMLNTIKRCVDKAFEKKVDVSVCGEMATDPMGVVVLLGMGIHNFSMSPASIKDIYSFIKGISFADAKELAIRVAESDSLRDVKRILTKWMKTRM